VSVDAGWLWMGAVEAKTTIETGGARSIDHPSTKKNIAPVTYTRRCPPKSENKEKKKPAKEKEEAIVSWLTGCIGHRVLVVSRESHIESLIIRSLLLTTRTPPQKNRQYEYKSDLPKGHKKDLSGEMPAAYQPRYVEAAWQDWWYVRTYIRAMWCGVV
jgi:hypothetical protein